MKNNVSAFDGDEMQRGGEEQQADLQPVSEGS